MNKKSIKSSTTLLGISIFLILLGVTYSFINATVIGTKRQVITAGYLELELFESENNLTIKNAMPMYDEVGMNQDSFDFQLSNSGTGPMYYELCLAKISNSNELALENVKYYLTKNERGTPRRLSEITDGVIDRGTIQEKETIQYALRLWIDSDVKSNEEIDGKELSYKLELYGGQANLAIAEHSITFNPNGGDLEKLNKTATIGFFYGRLPIPQKPGYLFNGWYNEEEELISESSIVKATDHVLTAAWNKNRYSLEVVPNEGIWGGSPASQSFYLEFEETKEISQPEREGYTFLNWDVTGKQSVLNGETFQMGIENSTITAVWQINQYQLTINPNGGKWNNTADPSVFQIDYHGTKKIENPEREGYTFTGWQIEGAGTFHETDFTMGNSNTTLTATWQVNNYPWISYHYQQNSDGEGYTMVEADTGSGEAEFGSEVLIPVLNYSGFQSPSARTLTIQKDEVPPQKNKMEYHYERNQYQLTVDPNGGSYQSSTSPTTVPLYFEEYILLANPSRTGYTFTNWSTEATSGVLDGRYFEMGLEDTTITANWKLGEYLVTFNAKGGSVAVSTKKVTYTETYGELPIPTKSGYLFLGWYTDEIGGEKIENDTVVTIGKKHTLYARWKVKTVSDLAFMSENLNDTCEMYDDGTDTFLKRQCSKNYVWYSGKLWRVVSKNNETGNVKMITDNSITDISYNSSYNSENELDFNNSFIDQWLQQEFLPTLQKYGNFLVKDTIWDASSFAQQSPPARPDSTTTYTRTVGLLNEYEYTMTYFSMDSATIVRDSFLDRDEYWWLMTQGTGGIKTLKTTGDTSTSSVTTIRGVRPAVVLQKNVQVVSGDGTIDQPYRFAEESVLNGYTYLSSRPIGEYVLFDDELYRISDNENGLGLKIVAVDPTPKIPATKFSNGTEEYDQSLQYQALQNYYNNLDYKWQSLLSVGTWYFGTASGDTGYKAHVCSFPIDTSINLNSCSKSSFSTLDERIGLPRVGEMFTSQITRGEKKRVYTMNRYDTKSVWYISEWGVQSADSINVLSLRPSFYLASVKIASDNTGDGTYEHPFTLEY